MGHSIIGYIGGFLLAVCGLPQAIECAKTGNANGLNWMFLLAWFFGEVFMFAYVIQSGDIPLIMNITFNLILVIIILRYKMHPRE